MSPKVLTKQKRHLCKNFKRCGQEATGPRAKFCLQCFKTDAARNGRRSSGNAGGNPGNAGNAAGNPGNAGNAAGNPENVGNAAGNPENAGNVAGNPGNAGNTKVGPVKKRSGKRSGVRRSAKQALVVKKEWLKEILDGRKTWEIRSKSTSKRGWIHFAQSQAGGKLMGRARLTDCIRVPKKDFPKHYNKHRVSNLKLVPYRSIFAWVLEDAEEFDKPFDYRHKQGAVIWVDV